VPAARRGTSWSYCPPRPVDDLLAKPPDEAAQAALADPPLVAALLAGMRSAASEDERGRAGAAAELVARQRPELLAPHADALIDIAATTGEAAVRVSAAQMLARVELSDERTEHATRALESYLDAGDSAVQAWALSAIVAIANEHPALRAHAAELVGERVESDDEQVRDRAQLLQGQADSWPS
jgi:hypothetical protein